MPHGVREKVLERGMGEAETETDTLIGGFGAFGECVKDLNISL